MKKVLCAFLIVLTMICSAIAEEIKYYPVDARTIGASLNAVLASLEKHGVEYHQFPDKQDNLTCVVADLSVFGFDCYYSTLLFSPENQLVYIRASINKGTFDSVYATFIGMLGNASKFHLPYVDCDTDCETYLRHIFPIELSWDKYGVTYELIMSAEAYTEVKSSLLHGTEIIDSSSHDESFDVYIYDPAFVKKYF